MHDVADLQRQKAQEMIGRSVFEEPTPESLERKCQRLVEAIKDVIAETDVFTITADYFGGNLRVRAQLLDTRMVHIFNGMDLYLDNSSEQVERCLDLGGITFFAIIHETPTERVARMLSKLPEEERRQVLESITQK